MHVWAGGKCIWMEPREHLSRKFKEEYIDKIRLELKELKLLGWHYEEYQQAGYCEVFEVRNGYIRYLVSVYRKREYLRWVLTKTVRGSQRIYNNGGFERIWNQLKQDIMKETP